MLLALRFFSATPGAESGVMSAADPSPPRPEVSVDEESGLTVIHGTDFDRAYGSPATSAAEDLEALHGILGNAMLLLKDFHRRPLADNADFVAVLQGNNPHQVAWIRPGHPFVSEAGELLDRWGQPVFFHREAAEQTTLRSAGPDQVMWTEDDVVFE
jgi:hypothetical protein